jgi:RNA polymerase primary sigma factor
MDIPMLRPERSIDDFVDPEEGTRLAAFLADPRAGNQVQRIHDIEVRHLVRQALVSLDERERHIIQNRFGILGGREETLEEISRGLRLSRERVRQLEQQAKQKLRARLSCHQAWLL